MNQEIRHANRTYRLLQKVGEGGFGTVFKALEVETGEFVAVKHLKNAACGDRFRREADVMRRFSDPCFTRFVDYFDVEGCAATESFLVMEYLPGMPGSSLKDVIGRRRRSGLPPLPGADVLRAFARYAHSLSVLHRNGIYHRDIKPSNLYYPEGAPERAAVMDFGIVMDVYGTITKGGLVGTLDYMPPESVEPHFRGSAGMDVYALGLCLYEALTGRQGYPRLTGGSSAVMAFYKRSVDCVQPAFDDPEIVCRPRLRELLFSMTHPDARKRLSDAVAVERILLSTDWSQRRPETARSVGGRLSAFFAKALAGCAAAMLVGLAVAFVWQYAASRFAATPPADDSPAASPAAQPAQPTQAARPSQPAPLPAAPRADPRADEDAVALEADAIEAIYLSEGREAGDRAWQAKSAAWRKKRLSHAFWQGVSNSFARAADSQAARRRRQREEAAESERLRQSYAQEERRADEEACQIVAAYEDPAVMTAETAERHRRWLEAWRQMGDGASRARIASRLEEARNERRRADNGMALVRECRRLMAESLKATDVKAWRKGLDAAARRLATATASKKVGERAARTVRRELAAAHGWSLGEISNRTLVKVSFEGVDIPPLSARVFSFTNGFPDPAVVVLSGMRPIPIRRRDFDSRTVEISESDLVRCEGTSRVRVPPLPRNVVCLVDDVLCTCGETPIAEGRHVCVFRNKKATFAGVRDFRDSRSVVATAAGGCTALVPPAKWDESREYQAAREKAESERIGDDAFDRCRRLLRTFPLEDRQDRLKQAFELFSDYQTAQALGAGRLGELKALYQAERRRAVGFVENFTSSPLVATLGFVRIEIPPHCREQFVCDGGMPLGADVAARGMEPIPLLAASLDDGTFRVKPDMLRPLPVIARVPSLDEGVSCYVSGRRLDRRSAELLPGRYVCAYRKVGCEDQRFRFDVSDEDLDLPCPGEWVERKVAE